MSPTKQFLPVRVPFSTDDTVGNGVIPAVYLPSHVKIPPTLRKFLPLFTVMTFIFGSAFLGLSFSIVPADHIGYYIPISSCTGCEVPTYEPGAYMTLPWNKGTFKVIGISDRNITVGKVYAHNTTYVAECAVKSVNEYIKSLAMFDNSIDRLDMEIGLEVRNQMVREEYIDSTNPYYTYGLAVNNIYYL